MYHGVAEVSGDPRRSLVPPLGVAVLREQLRYLRSHHDVVPVGEFCQRVACRRPGDRPLTALTFDDDLESHRTIAAPLLAEFGLPATFFLTGISLDRPSTFWWQDLDTLFARQDGPWAKLCHESKSRWGLGSLNVDLHQLAKTIEMATPDDRDSFARFLRELVDSEPSDPGVSSAMVRELVGMGFEIGFHTRYHYHLQTLDDDALRRAMREGVERLSAVAGHPLSAIAYPHCEGDLRIGAAAADAGFSFGFVCNNRAVGSVNSPLLLSRVNGWQKSLGEFALLMARVSLAASEM